MCALYEGSVWIVLGVLIYRCIGRTMVQKDWQARFIVRAEPSRLHQIVWWIDTMFNLLTNLDSGFHPFGVGEMRSYHATVGDCCRSSRRLLQALRCTSHVSSVMIYTGPAGSRQIETRNEHLPYDLKKSGRTFDLQPCLICWHCAISTIDSNYTAITFCFALTK